MVDCVLLILQLFVSAVLIILGSLRSVESHTAIVILGAATAIIVVAPPS